MIADAGAIVVRLGDQRDMPELGALGDADAPAGELGGDLRRRCK
jgi:hypothetical protein